MSWRDRLVKDPFFLTCKRRVPSERAYLDEPYTTFARQRNIERLSREFGIPTHTVEATLLRGMKTHDS